MRLECPRKELFDAINAATSAASARTALPILQSLKVDASDGQVRVLGCDGEMWIERKVACMVHEPGAICLQARLLCDLVSSMGEGSIELKTLDGQGVLLTQGASEYRMVSLDAEDFPEPPEYGGESELRLPLSTLREAVDSVSFAVSTDFHRQVLTGVLFVYDGSKLTLVATDTHRLAVRVIEQSGIGSNMTAVVPEKALRAIKSMPLSEDAEVEIRFDSVRLGVEAGGMKVVSQLLAGTFPNWERVIPSDPNRSWSIERDQLGEKVKRTMILARDSAFRVRFKGSGDQVLLSAKSEEKGEAKEELTIVSDNGDIEIAFNGKYVLEALQPIIGPGVKVTMTESSRAAVIRPADDDQDYLCVIMPMALA